MLNRFTTAAFLLAIGTAVSGCGGSDEPTPAKPTSSAEGEQQPPAEEPAGPVTDTCKDKAGDGGPLDLRNVTVTTDDSGLGVVLTLAAPPPTGNTAMVGISVNSADENVLRQLAVKWVDGDTSGPFIFDMASAEQQNLPASAVTVAGKKVTITFPLDATTDLGSDWQWYAFSNAAGDDVDACPGAVNSFKKRTFPGS
jgi:hypothetical protein